MRLMGLFLSLAAIVWALYQLAGGDDAETVIPVEHKRALDTAKGLSNPCRTLRTRAWRKLRKKASHRFSGVVPNFWRYLGNVALSIKFSSPFVCNTAIRPLTIPSAIGGSMIVSTTPTTKGHIITRYCGVIAGEAILGANLVKDMFAGIRDW